MEQQTPAADQNLQHLKDEVATLQNQKEQWFARKQELYTAISSSISKIKEHKTRRDELTASVKSKKEARDALNKQIKDLITQLKPMTKDAPKAPVNKKGKPITVQSLKRDIETMRYKIETDGMNFDAEQKMMKVIKEKQKELDKMSGVMNLSSEARELSKNIDKLKKESDAIHDEIQHMAKSSQDEHESIIKLSAEIDKLRAEEKVVSEKCNEFKSQFKEKNSQVALITQTTQVERKEKATKKKAENAKREAQAQAQIQQQIEEQVVEVEKKIKEKRKLTTEDLLVFQAKNDNK
ncbi:MAG TPA: hypothetical protein VK158_06320 [Acidobacteriota bacterium]|nr:hypothetical protein [Acidobacteriota bacterium]